MISANAIASLAWLFEQALLRNSVGGADDLCVVSQCNGSAASADDKRIVALGISSYLFRIVALFEFAIDAPTVAHFASLQGGNAGAGEGQALLDCLCEFSNRVCGEVNRTLTAEFRHCGMSTPFVLDGSCLEHVALLAPTHTLTQEIVVNDALRFALTVCVCADAESSLDFRVDRSETTVESAGELELF